MTNKRFEFGELNPNFSARTGPRIDPQRFSAQHIQTKLIEQYTQATGFKTVHSYLKGVVLRIETPSRDGVIDGFFGLVSSVQEPLVRIRVRIPELHPYPDPDVYGPEGPDDIISLYPIFTAVNSEVQTPAVGEIVYVDYQDRDNLEYGRYYGPVFNKPVFGGVSEVITKNTGKLQNLFDQAKNGIKDFLAPPTSQNSNPTVISPNQSDNNRPLDEPETSLENLDEEFRNLLLQFEAELNTLGLPFTRNETFRSTERQQHLYAQGRTRDGEIITQRDGINKLSNHQSGKATDYKLDLEHPYWANKEYTPTDAYDLTPGPAAEAWRLFGETAVKLGLSWGGNYKPIADNGFGWDTPHIELV